MLSKDKITEIFAEANAFWKVFDSMLWRREPIPTQSGKI